VSATVLGLLIELFGTSVSSAAGVEVHFGGSERPSGQQGLSRCLHPEISRTTARGQMTAATQFCYQRGGFFEGCDSRREEGEGRLKGSGANDDLTRNAANPRIGSGMQQARNLRAEKTVEVVRNHEDGTCLSSATASHASGNARVRRRSERCRWRGIENPRRGGRFIGQGRVDGFEEDAKRPRRCGRPGDRSTRDAS